MNDDGRPRLMLAAPASGTGKTTITTGLLAALAARGLRPAAFKCGPDFIDPLFHREVLGVSGGNLDLFFTPPGVARGLLARAAAQADVSVLEAAMGYYDGIGVTDRASAWRIAVETETPVVLVVRPKGSCCTQAAVIAGLARFRENSGIRGVLLNRCRDAFARTLTTVIEKETGLPVLGRLPELSEASVESRHLGLTTPDGIADLHARLRVLAAQMEKTVDITALLAIANSAPPLCAALPEVSPVSGAPVRIAVAKDAAFCFQYAENLELLREFGAELVFFSPLADAHLPENIGALCLGGGYPELHAARLAANTSLRREIKTAVADGLPTIAESGGFLYLQTELADADGRLHPMAGALPGVGRNAGRAARFGYVTLRARRDNLLCDAGVEIPAHEFHYWDSENCGDDFTATKASGSGSWPCVAATPTLFAGFPHIYFWSNPPLAKRFVEAAARRHGS